MEEWEKIYIDKNKASLALNTKCSEAFLNMLVNTGALGQKDVKLLVSKDIVFCV